MAPSVVSGFGQTERKLSFRGALKTHEEPLKIQSIEIDREEDIYLNSDIVSLDGLKDSMGAMDKDVPILIRANGNIALQTFVDVPGVLKNLGFKKVSLQTEERKGRR